MKRLFAILLGVMGVATLATAFYDLSPMMIIVGGSMLITMVHIY